MLGTMGQPGNKKIKDAGLLVCQSLPRRSDDEQMSNA